MYHHDKNHSVILNRACHFGPFIENAGIPWSPKPLCYHVVTHIYATIVMMRIYMHNIRIGSNGTGEHIHLDFVRVLYKAMY